MENPSTPTETAPVITAGAVAQQLAERLIRADVDRNAASIFSQQAEFEALMLGAPALQQQLQTLDYARFDSLPHDYHETLSMAVDHVHANLSDAELTTVRRAVRNRLNAAEETTAEKPSTPETPSGGAAQPTEGANATAMTRRAQRTLNAAVIIAALSAIVTLGLHICGGLIFPAPGLLPDIEPDPPTLSISTVPHDDMKVHPEIVTIRTHTRDWRNFKIALQNDVRRHGGWHEYHRDGQTAYYVPSNYIDRVRPLLDTSGQRPHSSAYAQWTQNVAGTRPTDPAGLLTDTRLIVKHDTPVSDHRLVRSIYHGWMALMSAALATGVAAAATIAYADARRQRERRAAVARVQ